MAYTTKNTVGSWHSLRRPAASGVVRVHARASLAAPHPPTLSHMNQPSFKSEAMDSLNGAKQSCKLSRGLPSGLCNFLASVSYPGLPIHSPFFTVNRNKYHAIGIADFIIPLLPWLRIFHIFFLHWIFHIYICMSGGTEGFFFDTALRFVESGRWTNLSVHVRCIFPLDLKHGEDAMCQLHRA
jgi:hypothetical protein